jgi:hypothetical protein
MADICDLAQEHYERSMEEALARARAKEPEIKSTGFCLACELPLAKENKNPRFCGPDCRDDYDKASV